ncbi:Spx/MgsR family RNA polymerase-binding regulatory protein [Hellea balneolensis]|uniref:Spx/MgsR family RNA polymerase-binding regulatory protein n=1 Tax=Hellea balneolensis TaxID=287478 RepID=UPI000413AA90|nr:Spx/MgsR family RNA polymerase-binding regulatory protein [Hellea balneolensis]
MTLTVYHLKTCDTCRKAIKALQGAEHELSLVDVRADGVQAQDLERFAKAVGWEKLLNTRSTTWRGLDDADKADMNATKAVALMAQHPTLIKRPVIERQDALVTVGWTKDVQAGFEL